MIIAKQFTAVFLGEFILALSVTTPIFLFFSFKMRTIIIVNSTYNVEQYLNARFIANSFALILCLFIGAIYFPDIPYIIFILLCIYKWCDSWSEMSYSYFHKYGLFSKVSLSQGCRSALSILTFTIASLNFTSPLITLASWVFVTFVFSYIDVKNIVRHNILKNTPIKLFSTFTSKVLLIESFNLYKKYLTLSASLLVGSLFIYIPNFVIEKYISIESAGQFAAISYFLIAGGLVVSSISQAALPYFSKTVSSYNSDSFFRLTIVLCLTGACIGVLGLTVAIFVGEHILSFFYNTNISNKSIELNWIMAAAGIKYIYIFVGTAMNSLNLFHIQTKIYMASTISLLFLCLFLVPLQGTLGAAKSMFWVTCIEFTLFVIAFIHNYKKNGIKVHA